MADFASSQHLTRQARNAIVLLTLASTCQFVDRAIVSVILDPLRAEFAVRDAVLGLIAGPAFSIPYALAVLPISALVERVDRIRLLTLLLSIWSAATIFCGWATSILTLIVMRGVVGIAEAGASPAALSLISSWAPAERRGRAFGTFFLASAGGTIISFAGGGFLVAHLGWRMTFVIAGIAGLILAVVMRFTLQDPEIRSHEHRVKDVDREPALAMLLRLITYPTLRHLLLGSGFAMALMVGMWAWATSFFLRVHHVDLQTAGLIVAAGAGLCAGGGTIVAGIAADRAGTGSAVLNIPLIILPVVAVSWLVVAATSSFPVAIIGFFVGSALAPMFLAPTYKAILAHVEPSERGITLAGVQIAISVLGSALGPAIVGMVSGMTGSLGIALVVLTLTAPLAFWHFLRARLTWHQSGQQTVGEHSHPS